MIIAGNNYQLEFEKNLERDEYWSVGMAIIMKKLPQQPLVETIGTI